jgi:SAM-dependent methyltransferase
MREAAQALTNESHWAQRGSDISGRVAIERQCTFWQQAKLLAPVLRERGYRSVVEIGTYPGHVLAWACRVGGLHGTAIEFVPSQATALARAFPEFEVLSGDFLAEGTFERGRTWDVVCSFGLVEHWTDLRVPLARHAEMTGPGGTCIIGIPLHDGVYGRIMRALTPDLDAMHGHYSAAQLREAFVDVAGLGWTVERCGAIEGIGFWNCGIANWLERCSPAVRVIAQKTLGAWHAAVTRLPAPDSLRPNALLVARRA